MTIDELALEHQETKDRSLRNEGRIKKLEAENEVLHQLATSTAVMAEKLTTLTTSVDTLSDKVGTLEEKPGKRWDAIVDKTVWAVLAAIIAFMLGRIGL